MNLFSRAIRWFDCYWGKKSGHFPPFPITWNILEIFFFCIADIRKKNNPLPKDTSPSLPIGTVGHLWISLPPVLL